MKKFVKALLACLIGATGMVMLSSCDLIEDGNINDFVGEYESGTGVERTKHYYWGNTTIKGESTFLDSGCKILIYSNKRATLQYPNNGQILEGRVRVFSNYVTFTNFNFDSSYHFELKEDHSLVHSYYEDKHGLDYDFVTRHCALTYRGPIGDN